MIVKIIKNHFRNKKMYDERVVERKNETNTMNEKVSYNDLTYYFLKKESKPICFIDYNRPLGLLRKIKEGNTELEKARKN